MHQEPKEWLKKNYDDMTATEKSAAEANIIREESNINQIYQGCAERAVKSLFLLNGSGAIAILAYLHAQSFYANLLIRLSLFSFLCGLLMALCIVARDFDWAKTKSQDFHSDVRQFLRHRNIPFDNIRWFRQDQPSDTSPKATERIGIFSVAFFIIGLLTGTYGYLFSFFK